VSFSAEVVVLGRQALCPADAQKRRATNLADRKRGLAVRGEADSAGSILQSHAGPAPAAHSQRPDRLSPAFEAVDHRAARAWGSRPHVGVADNLSSALDQRLIAAFLNAFRNVPRSFGQVLPCLAREGP